MKTLYEGNWSCNAGSTFSYGHKGTNKKVLRKDIIEMCRGNTFSGCSGNWSIYEVSSLGEKFLIEEGSVK